MKKAIDCLCFYVILLLPLRWTEGDCHPIINTMIARAGDWAYQDHQFDDDEF